jgi:hypothetical protein
LALALYYRAKLSASETSADYDEGISYLNDAINYAKYKIDAEPRNPHLLAAVLVTKSRYLSSRYRPGKDADGKTAHQHLSELTEAEMVAIEACDVSVGIREMESEAWSTLGDVYIDLAHLHKRHKEKFYTYFDKSLEALRRALAENHGENIRIDAVCYLRLTKLCLLNRNTKILAYEYFEQWKKIENEVEHEYCKVMGRELQKKMSGPVLLIKAGRSLNYDQWEKKLSQFLLEEALKKFVAAHEGKDYKPDKLQNLLATHLRIEMGYGKSKVSQLIKDKELMKEIGRMRAR